MKQPNPSKPGKVGKAEQRVIIAKDALQQLRAEQYLAQQGVYTGGNLTDDLIEQSKGDDKLQAQPFIKKAAACTVCAKGALFLSAIRKYNKATVYDVICDNMEVAEKIFGRKQFDLIEAAFEQWTHVKSNVSDDGDDVPMAVQRFAFSIVDDNQRLEAILKNIIKNKGTFKL